MIVVPKWGANRGYRWTAIEYWKYAVTGYPVLDAKQDYWFPKLTLYFDPYTTKHLYLYPSIQNQGTTWVRKAPVRQAASRRRRLVGRRTVRSSWRHRTRVDPRWRISWWTGHDGVWSMMAYGSSRPGCLPKKDLPANGELH